jgi:sulfite reductase (ferredoxin)
MSESLQGYAIADAKKPIDLRGVQCPMNVVRIKLSLEKVQLGHRIEFILDNGDHVQHVTKTLAAQGHTIIKQTQEIAYCTLLVQKG